MSGKALSSRRRQRTKDNGSDDFRARGAQPRMDGRKTSVHVRVPVFDPSGTPYKLQPHDISATRQAQSLYPALRLPPNYSPRYPSA